MTKESIAGKNCADFLNTIYPRLRSIVRPLAENDSEDGIWDRSDFMECLKIALFNKNEEERAAALKTILEILDPPSTMSEDEFVLEVRRILGMG